MDEAGGWGSRAGELTLQDYLAILQRRKWLFLAILAAALTVVTAWNFLATPMYESTASVLLRTNNNEQLFPSVPNAQRNDFNRRIDAEFEFSSTSAFAREADARTPAGVTVRPNIDADANNSSSTLDFVARSDDQVLAQQGAMAWADTYLEVRRRTAIDRIAISVLDAETQITELEQQKAEILAPIAPIDEALQSESDSDAISRLTTQRLSLSQALEDELLPVNIQLRELSQNLARLRIAESLLTRENVSGVLAKEAPLGRQVEPQIARNTALGAVLGLLLAAGAALVAESLTATIRSADDLHRLAPGIATLAQLPDLPKDATAHQLAYQSGSAYAEALERLVSSVLYQRVGRPGDRMKVLVTSAMPGEGKTTVAANLARRLSLTSVRTLVVDADLRRPKLHSELGLARTTGLSELLTDGRSLEKHFVRLRERSNVGVLGAGAATDQAAILLRQRFRAAIERMPLKYELLIVDAPPVLAVTDAEVLVDSVDEVLLVVRAQATKTHQLTQALRQLNVLGASIAGFVLVGVRDEEFTGYSYSYATLDQASATPATAPRSTEQSASPKRNRSQKQQRSEKPDPRRSNGAAATSRAAATNGQRPHRSGRRRQGSGDTATSPRTAGRRK